MQLSELDFIVQKRARFKLWDRFRPWGHGVSGQTTWGLYCNDKRVCLSNWFKRKLWRYISSSLLLTSIFVHLLIYLKYWYKTTLIDDAEILKLSSKSDDKDSLKNFQSSFVNKRNIKKYSNSTDLNNPLDKIVSVSGHEISIRITLVLNLALEYLWNNCIKH